MADNTTINAGTGGDSIATDDISSGVASGAKVQRVKAGFGADGSYVDVATATGMPTTAGYLEATGSAAANNTDLVSVDAAGYRWVACQLTGTWSGTVSFQQSNDGTNWVAVLVNRPDSTQNAFGTATANNIYCAPLAGRYFRARMTSYTSGTAVANCGFSVDPVLIPAASVRMDTFNAFGTSDNNNWGTAFTVNSTTGVWNGAGFDRARTANNADATTGTGVMGAGNMGFDGTNWRRARADTAGNIGVIPTPAAGGGWTPYSNTALSSTKQQVKASAGTLGGWFIYNDNAAEMFVQVWDVASGSITVGTTAPTYTLAIPAGSAANMEVTCGIAHGTAINIAATTTATGSTAPTTALNVLLLYK